jgi:hypothetical protein
MVRPGRNSGPDFCFLMRATSCGATAFRNRNWPHRPGGGVAADTLICAFLATSMVEKYEKNYIE